MGLLDYQDVPDPSPDSLFGGSSPSRPAFPVVEFIDKSSWSSPKNNRSGKFSGQVVSNVARAAIARGLDPFHAIGIGLMESNLGNNSDIAKFGRTPEEQDAETILNGYEKGSSGDPWVDSLKRLSAGFAKYPDRPDIAIQYYNGMGKVKNAYGVKGVIDMKQNPIYGKRVLEYADQLRNNPQVVDIVNQVMGE